MMKQKTIKRYNNEMKYNLFYVMNYNKYVVSNQIIQEERFFK